MTAWQLRNEYKELQRKQLAIQKAVQRASDGRFIAPLSKNGVQFLQDELERIRQRMREINDQFKRKEFN